MKQNKENHVSFLPYQLGLICGFWLGATAIITTSMGCGTTTQRLATEQLLMSNAVDEAISQIEFGSLSNQKVYLDTTYLKPVKGFGFVNADYIISSLRQHLTASRCLIQEDRESADIIIEPRVGALGTDGHDVTYGLPQTSAFSSAATVISGSPIPAMPEISLGRSDAQSGIAKVIVFAYDKETKQPVWQSGIAKAESDSSNTWVLGAGPFQKGSIYENVRFAGIRIKGPPLGHAFANSSKDNPELDEHQGLNYADPFVFKTIPKPAPSEATSIADEANDTEVQQASFDKVSNENTPD